MERGVSQMWLNLKRTAALPALLLAVLVTLLSPEGSQAQPVDRALSAAIARMEAAPANAAIDGQPPTQSLAEAGDQSDADDPPVPSRSGDLAVHRYRTPTLHRRAASWLLRRPASYRARAPPLA